LVRCSLLILLAMSRRVHWILEQPSSSLCCWMPRFQVIVSNFNVYEVWMWMGMFGGPTLKATRLYAGSQWPFALRRKLDRSKFVAATKTVRTYKDKSGVSRVTGAPALKASQQYPDDYGKEVARLYKETGMHEEVDVPWIDVTDTVDGWGDALLHEVCKAFAVHVAGE